MSEPLTPSERAKRILALADDELSPDEAKRIRELCKGDPLCIDAQVAHQKALRQACSKTMCTGEPPAALKAAIEKMCRCSVGSAGKPGGGVLGKIGRWLPMAMAALIAIAAGGWLTTWITQEPGSPDGGFGGQVVLAADLSPNQVETFGARHRQCVTGEDTPINPELFPKDVQALPAAVAAYLHHDMPAVPLDLSSVGYRYELAGGCTVPGQGSVHVVYKAAGEPGRGVSLWMRPYDGKLACDPGKVYGARCAENKAAILVWREGGIVFYLVGESPQAVEQVAQVIHPTKQAT